MTTPSTTTATPEQIAKKAATGMVEPILALNQQFGFPPPNATLRADLERAREERDVAVRLSKFLTCEWTSDQPLPEDERISAAHPMETGNHALFEEAMRLVGARYSKFGLVNLVNWQLSELDASMRREGVLRDALASINQEDIEDDGTDDKWACCEISWGDLRKIRAALANPTEKQS